MSNVAIRVENLGKMYRIGGKQEKYSTLRDTLVDIAATPYRKIRGLMRGESASGLKEEIWALKDVSFEVKHGEVVGIIGRNGAGKSTLLKILSRITEPTTGYADVYGRVGALLEVGTGFHPELTGRENVYLNGAILGMTRRDIDHKFDEIVDFAGVEKFIDTPVKHYSSGMGLRLGFAVAAHLEPEILVVDEVLAVGDAEFQKKCLGKMGQVAGQGRTVIFVSHNMVAVNQLCSKAILLRSGEKINDGLVDSVLAHYLRSNEVSRAISLFEREDRIGNGNVRLVDIALVNDQMESVTEVLSNSVVRFLVGYQSQTNAEIKELSVTLRVEDSFGQYLFSLASLFTGEEFRNLPSSGKLCCHVPQLPLIAGLYRMYISLYSGDTKEDAIERAFEFTVVSSNVFGSGRLPNRNKHGSIIVQHKWELNSSILR